MEDCEGCYALINSELYEYLVTGNAVGFHKATSTSTAGEQADDVHVHVHVPVPVPELRCARDKGTVLHIAASFGHTCLIEDILWQWPELMVKANSEGDLPIHSALKTGKLNAIDALTKWLKQGNNKEITDQVLGWNSNTKGNTALHIALELYDADHLQMVWGLVDLYPRASYVMNKDEICPLYLAIKQEFVDLVQLMLVKLQPIKADALASLRTGRSVLHAAVSAKRTEMLECMLNYGNSELMNIWDDKGWTALSFAACMGSVKKVEIFLEKVPSSAFICNKDKSYPIHQEVLGGHIEIIDLLRNTTLLLNAKGQNIFHLASLRGDSQLVSHLLNMNLPEADSLINQKDEEGNTPLHLATFAKHCEVIEALIQYEGINIGLSNKEGLTANDLAKKLALVDGDNSIVKRLYMVLERATARGLKCFPFDNELYRLLCQGKIDEVDQIVSCKKLQLRDLESSEDGSTVLHLAASTGQHQLVVDLFRRGCSILMEQGNNFGDLPIHSAVKAGNLLSLKALFQWSHNQTDHIRICERQNVDGNTALHVALLDNHKEIAKYLYERCPQAAYCLNKNNICPLFLVIKKCGEKWGERSLVNSMIEGLEGHAQLHDLVGGKSVAHIAILTRNVGILESIINRAPRLMDSVDIRGRNPLSYAAYTGYVKGVELLLSRLPDLECKRDKDEDGSFPIHQAAKSGQVQILRLLHPKTWLLNYKLQNVLHVAAEAGRVNVVEYLLKMQEFNKLLNTGDHNGNTPLHLAVGGVHVRTVFSLVKRKKYIDTNSTNTELWTAGDLFQMHQLNQGPKVPSVVEPTEITLIRLMVCRKRSYVRIGDQQGGKGKEKNTKQEKASKSANGDKELRADKLLENNTKQEKASKSANGDKELLADKLLIITTLILTVSYAALVEAQSFYFDTQTGKLRPDLAKQYHNFIISNECAYISAVAAALSVFVGILMPRFAKSSLLGGQAFIYFGVISMSSAFVTWCRSISSAGERSAVILLTVVYGILLGLFTLFLLPPFLFKLRFYYPRAKFRTPMWYITAMLIYCRKEGADLDFTI